MALGRVRFEEMNEAGTRDSVEHRSDLISSESKILRSRRITRNIHGRSKHCYARVCQESTSTNE
jgi:hypothetical protein